MYRFLVLTAVLLAGGDAFAEDPSGEKLVDLFPTLESTLDLVDEQKDLPDKAWLGSDKRSHQKDINELLDEAVSALGDEEIVKLRTAVGEARESILNSRKRIAQYRREKVRAPAESTLGLDGLPFFTTKTGYQLKIDAEEKRIKESRRRIAAGRKDLKKRIRSLGIEIEDEEFELLVSTVNGDSYIDMTVAFSTIKSMTTQLAQLTEESGEDVQTAKKYFGMYTILLRMLDRIQNRYVEDIDKVHTPKIEQFVKDAEQNIAEAETAIESGGNQIILQQNIKSNRLTLKALSLYRRYLQTQRTNILEINRALQSDLLTADNTYNTVSLATQVVSLLQTGVKNFDAVIALQPPTMIGFENQELRNEFMKLTERMQD